MNKKGNVGIWIIIVIIIVAGYIYHNYSKDADSNSIKSSDVSNITNSIKQPAGHKIPLVNYTCEEIFPNTFNANYDPTGFGSIEETQYKNGLQTLERGIICDREGVGGNINVFHCSTGFFMVRYVLPDGTIVKDEYHIAYNFVLDLRNCKEGVCVPSEISCKIENFGPPKNALDSKWWQYENQPRITPYQYPNVISNCNGCIIGSQCYPFGSVYNGMTCAGGVPPLAKINLTGLDNTDLTSNIFINGVVPTKDRLNEENRAYSFDGKTGCITIPDSNYLDLQDQGTITLWAKKSKDADYQLYLTKGRDGYQLAETDTTNPGHFTIRWGMDADSLVSKEDVAVGDWNFIVATYDGKYISLYLNGILSDTKEYSRRAVVNSEPLMIGCRGDSAATYFSGSIDEVGIFDQALSSEQIANLYEMTRNGDFNENKFDMGNATKILYLDFNK